MHLYVTLSEELTREVDRLAGKRKRSQFIREAIAEKLSRKDEQPEEGPKS